MEKMINKFLLQVTNRIIVFHADNELGNWKLEDEMSTLEKSVLKVTREQTVAQINKEAITDEEDEVGTCDVCKKLTGVESIELMEVPKAI